MKNKFRTTYAQSKRTGWHPSSCQARLPICRVTFTGLFFFSPSFFMSNQGQFQAYVLTFLPNDSYQEPVNCPLLSAVFVCTCEMVAKRGVMSDLGVLLIFQNTLILRAHRRGDIHQTASHAFCGAFSTGELVNTLIPVQKI